MMILAQLLGGLGLLFLGLKALSTHLQQATGRRARHLLRAATRSPLMGLACGTLAGAATQSSNAVAVISGNLVRGGLFTTRDAIPVVAGGNVGTAALVFVAAIDFRLVVLYLLAVVGFAVHLKLDQKPAWRDWMGVLLGLGLMLLGLDFIKEAPRGLDAGALAQGLGGGVLPLVGFGAGLLTAILSQSSSTPTIVVLALMQAGVLGLSDAFFIVLGANLGSGLATLFSAGGLQGTGRQLCYVHILVKLVGCLLLFALWTALTATGNDPARILSAAGGGSASLAISMLFLALQLAGALPVALARGITEKVAIAFSPPSLEDGASQPRYIDERAMEAPASALDLSQKEFARLVALLPTLLPDLDLAAASGGAERQALWRGADAIAKAVDHFLVDIIARAPGQENLNEALRQQALLEMLRALQDTLHDFSRTVEEFDTLPPLAFNLSESLRAIVLSLADAENGEDFVLIGDLTGDRSALLDRIRRSIASATSDGGEDTRRLLLATSLFERAIWLMHRIAVALRPVDPEAGRKAV